METRSRKVLLGLALAVAIITPLPARQPSSAPLDIARILAARYPAQPIMSYIPALSWSGQLRLSLLTGEPQWRQKALQHIHAFTSGQSVAIAEPYRLTSLAGALAFAEAGADDRAAAVLFAKVAYFILPDTPKDDVKFNTGWTDDMFMAGAVLSRSGNEPQKVLRRLLKTYANKLQRPDGLFIHAENGPHAWGRGNGFALLGITEALTHMPES
jgi:uncharacterized membrane protein YkvA (DUF1232 family)